VNAGLLSYFRSSKYRPDLGRTDAGSNFTAGYDNSIVPFDRGGCDVVLWNGTGGCPFVAFRVKDKRLFRKAWMVVFEFITFKEQRAVSSTENEDLLLTVRDSCSCHDAARQVGSWLSCACVWSILPYVFQELYVVAFLASSAHDVNAVMVPATLGNGNV